MGAVRDVHQDHPLSFTEAINRTERWLGQWQAGSMTTEALAQQLEGLLPSADGRRGFFVVALAGPSPLLDEPPAPVVEQLHRGGKVVVDLVVRNLAMGTAMALAHQRQGHGEQAQGSLQVQRRAQALLAQLDPLAVRQRLDQLLAATGGHGADVAFLKRWNYDAAQRQAIAKVASATRRSLPE
ncbi:MAG: hypothetical protein F4Z75_02050 [Synechococcus sp. SB0668_bin_15]|nr:hypothetical protein [Synechococcus sp. SB0668_bin_15]MXZ83420.1 hypothetical protein [Synechococcus sp. SB0666_bin_14]MYA90929.1 hypothetical protein [Synechococcus sp. SB0663_bin_10]MYC49190.1 hypothetical protein [Synechococcus sp. SB0662_bin_14]MYG46354.1 hypothetical protein [Synechococcus sp. SB0675_bin_6]MYJ60327.1 hypothetical protein [Synechococcus sp. SB0672_bin_6]MYK90823.1 hypothetical protein [Synechococcus sp. SB0669_bin_8]